MFEMTTICFIAGLQMFLKALNRLVNGIIGYLSHVEQIFLHHLE